MIRKRRSKPRPGRLEGAELENLRRSCFNRANGRCENCGCYMRYWKLWELDPIGFEMAHKRGKRMWGDHIDQVRALCQLCHHESHNPKACPKKPEAA
jgi:hypothetical protein